jgi:hypothetical protein
MTSETNLLTSQIPTPERPALSVSDPDSVKKIIEWSQKTKDVASLNAEENAYWTENMQRNEDFSFDILELAHSRAEEEIIEVARADEIYDILTTNMRRLNPDLKAYFEEREFTTEEYYTAVLNQYTACIIDFEHGGLTSIGNDLGEDLAYRILRQGADLIAVCKSAQDIRRERIKAFNMSNQDLQLTRTRSRCIRGC